MTWGALTVLPRDVLDAVEAYPAGLRVSLRLGNGGVEAEACGAVIEVEGRRTSSRRPPSRAPSLSWGSRPSKRSASR